MVTFVEVLEVICVGPFRLDPLNNFELSPPVRGDDLSNIENISPELICFVPAYLLLKMFVYFDLTFAEAWTIFADSRKRRIREGHKR